MGPDPRHVPYVAAADLEVRLVLIEGDGNRDRPAIVAPAPSDGANPILRTPKIENTLVIGIIKIIGDADCLGPVPALAVGDPRDPGAGRRIAAIAEAESWAANLARRSPRPERHCPRPPVAARAAIRAG